MILTNKYKLPKAFEKFSKNDEYSRGDADISVTSLIDSPQVFRLRTKHDSEITEDVSDQIFSLLGTAIHLVLERGADENAITEERLYMKCPGPGNLRLSGAIDLQTPSEDGWILSDYKTCSTATLMHSSKPEWHKQLNCYAELVEQAKGETVASLEVIAICRDWSAFRRKQKGYPASPIVKVDIPLWTSEERREYIFNRIQAHELQKLCNAQDRWSKPGRFAVMREHRVRAIKILDTRKEAEDYIQCLKPAGRGGGYFVEYRPSKNIRCENNYCQVSNFCEQWSKIYQDTFL